MHHTTYLSFLLFLTIFDNPKEAESVGISLYWPSSSPISGGAQVTVVGSEFTVKEPYRSKCQFRTSSSARLSPITVVKNSTHLSCPTPTNVPFLGASALYIAVRLEITSGTNVSSWVPFVFFDLTKIHVSGISPTEGLLEREISISIYGQNFVETNEIVCLVDGVPDAHAEFVNSGLLKCRLLPRKVEHSLRVSLNVSLNGGDSTGIIPATADTGLTFFHPAPNLTSISFTNSLSQLWIDFNTETVLSGLEMKCETILDDASFLLIGSRNATCAWSNQQQRRVVIDLPPSAQVRLGSLISIKPGIFATRYEIYSRHTSGGLPVTAPKSVALPVAIIEGPRVMTALCGNVTYTGRNSFLVGYSGLKYFWSVTSNNATLDNLINSNLNGYHEDSVSLETSLFMGLQNFSLNLNVMSFLGFYSNETKFFITPINVTSPMVTILGPQSRQIICSDGHIFEAQTICSKETTTGLLLSWQLFSGDDQMTDLTPKSWHGQESRLFVQSGTLLCGSSYLLKVSVGAAFSFLHIQSQHPSLHARIVGGEERALDVGRPIILDGSPSYDPATEPVAETYQWDCNVANSSSKCSGVILENRPVIQIPPFQLNTGTYEIKLTYSKGSRSSTAQTLINLLPSAGQVPVVAVLSPVNSGSINIRKKVIIEATVINQGEATAEWSCLSTIPGYGYIDLTDPSKVSTPQKYDIVAKEKFDTSIRGHRNANKNESRLDLVIQPDTLLSDMPYRFRLTVRNSQGYSSSDAVIRTSALPSSCQLEIEPASGTALEVEFRLEVKGCAVVEKRQPLLYQFGIWKQSSNDIVWLSAPSLNSQLQTVLIPGSPIHIVARVQDAEGVYTVEEGLVTVHRSRLPLNLTQIQQIIQDEMAIDWPSGLQRLLVVLMALNNDSLGLDQAEIAAFKSHAFALVEQLYDTRLPDDKEYIMDAVSVLKELTEDDGLDPKGMEKTSAILNSSLSTIVEKRRESLNVEEGEQIMAVYSNILPLSEKVTEEFLDVLLHLGYGMCLNQGYSEVTESVVFQPVGVIGATLRFINGPQSVGCNENFNNGCPFTGDSKSDVNFGDSLDELLPPLNPVCFVSAQINQNLHAVQSDFAPVVKSDIVSLDLLQMDSGHVVPVENLADPIRIVVSLHISSAGKGRLECRYWDKGKKAWLADGCETIVAVGGSLAEGTGVLCECTHLSEFVVVEECLPGFYGVQCEKDCPQGRWGQDCGKVCSCSSRGLCASISGDCNCDNGWVGQQCENKCSEGLWEKNCSLTCDCLNNALCNPHTGECLCQAGWIGPKCNKICPTGSFGDGCGETCNCKNGADCIASTGKCVCLPGYHGTDCSEECDKWFFGLNCQTECKCRRNGTKTCQHVTGKCECHQKWNGTLCDNFITDPMPLPASFPIWVVAVAVVLVLVVVGSILLFFLYKKKKRGKLVIHPEGHRGDYEDDGVTFTRAESMELKIKFRRKRPSMIPEGDEDDGEDETDRVVKDGKIGWIVARMKSLPPAKRAVKSATVQEEEEEAKENEENKNEDAENVDAENPNIVEKKEPDVEFFPERIYLPPTATLADLREKLVEANWTSEKMSFRFLLRGDQRLFYSRDQEPVVILAQVFVDKEGYRTIHVWENHRHSAKRKSKIKRVTSGKPQSRRSLRRKAMENASGASSLATLSSYSSFTGTSYTGSTETWYTESGLLDDDGSEFSETESGSFIDTSDSELDGSDVEGEERSVDKSTKSLSRKSPGSEDEVEEDQLLQTSKKHSTTELEEKPSENASKAPSDSEPASPNEATPMLAKILQVTDCLS